MFGVIILIIAFATIYLIIKYLKQNENESQGTSNRVNLQTTMQSSSKNKKTKYNLPNSKG